ncbi:MAG: hypothetical protein SOI56_06640 [Eubacteriales bacterium]|jgi:hypothetical protein
MKITLEFENAEKFFKELPKFAALINFSGEFASFSHVKKSDLIAMLQDPDLPKIVERDGQKYVRYTDEQGEKLMKASEEAKAIETKAGVADKKEEVSEAMNPPEAPAEKPAEATEKPEEAKADGSPDKEEKPAEEPAEKKDEVSEVDARARLNQLVKATRYNASVKLIFKHFGAKVFGDLKPEHYAEAVKMADQIEKLSEEELLQKFQEAGIKAKKKVGA